MTHQAPTRGPGPLTGVRVLDFSRVLAGPHCGRMLTDLGADVIKIEPPEGDTTRFTYPRINSLTPYFTQQNVGKRNVSLDMRHPEAVDLLRRMADASDVVVENFRGGVMDRMGLGYATLSARNPRLVYGSISGYGQTGPWVTRRAYAAVIGAEAGLTNAQAVSSGQPPRNDPHSHADVYTALELVSGILAALYQRSVTGVGQWVEVSMAETMLSVNEHAAWEMRSDLDDTGDDDVPSFMPGDYPVLQTGAGRQVVVSGHPATNGTFAQFMATIDRPDLVDDPRLQTVGDRRRHLDVIIDAIQAWAGSMTDLDAIEAKFAENELAMGVLRTTRELGESEWAAARGAVVDVPDRGDGVIRVPNSPWHFSGADSGARGLAAYRGEHNREVLTELLGLGDDEVDRLTADGVLSARLPRQR